MGKTLSFQSEYRSVQPNLATVRALYELGIKSGVYYMLVFWALGKRKCDQI